MKSGEEKGDLINQSIMEEFVEQPLALPGSANYSVSDKAVSTTALIEGVGKRVQCFSLNCPNGQFVFKNISKK